MIDDYNAQYWAYIRREGNVIEHVVVNRLATNDANASKAPTESRGKRSFCSSIPWSDCSIVLYGPQLQLGDKKKEKDNLFRSIMLAPSIMIWKRFTCRLQPKLFRRSIPCSRLSLLYRESSWFRYNDDGLLLWTEKNLCETPPRTRLWNIQTTVV